MNKRKLGALGEKIAKTFLKQRGYKIIDKNFWCRYGEIDLIAQNQDYVVFIEVKLVTGNSIRNALEKVDSYKQYQLIKVARYYISLYQLEANFRFDVIAIANYKTANKQVQLIKNAFLI